MKKVIITLGFMAFLFSSCVLLPEVPTVTPTMDDGSQTPTIVLTEAAATSTMEPIQSTATQASTFIATVIPSQTPTKKPTATPTAVPYSIQAGTPVYTANFGYPNAGCNWLGVGGQIFDENGNPVINLVVWMRGSIGSTPFETVVLSGTAEGDKYGPGGYEAVIHNTVLDTSGVFSIQVLDLNGNILSDQVFFDTYAQCDQNLILINFTKN
ncbi:MAG: hypothetical protein AB2L18_01415 [Anaerolineaceae bacterium]